jgi:hypothetical protein
MMASTKDIPEPNRVDYQIALAVGACALAAYVRTLAPDVLYADSAEFQTLTYTLGTTHSTGYPVYLCLARLLGFLPLGSLAWRVNLLSAVSAAVTLSAIFLLTRYLTWSRIGALLGIVALGLSYAFWSQAIIAEVYTPALAFLSIIVLLLWRWHHAPLERNRSLLFAALFSGLGLGVHAFVALIAPAATIFVIWTSWARRVRAAQWRRSLAAAFWGLVVGTGLFLLTFFLTDINDPPTSFFRVALYPSRSIWGLEAADLDSPFERLWVTVSGLQWQDAMFPEGNDHMWQTFGYYAERLLSYEFSPLMFLCALLGLEVARRAVPKLAGFLLIALVTALFFILNYEPPDKFIFFLPTYALLAIGVGVGAGFLLELVCRHLVAGRKRWHKVFYLLAVVLLALVVIKPFGASRWRALQTGAATFVKDDYAYPLYNLEEPRRLASWRLKDLPHNAVLILEWRALYTMYYLAHVEHMRTDVTIIEASPHGGEGMVADTLIQTLKDALREDRPVYAERVYENLRGHFRVLPALGGEWYRLSLPRSD